MFAAKWLIFPVEAGFDYLCNSTIYSPDLSVKIRISQNCPYDFYKILQSFYTQGAPACAMASKSYDWNLRNIVKISPKIPTPLTHMRHSGSPWNWILGELDPWPVGGAGHECDLCEDGGDCQSPSGVGGVLVQPEGHPAEHDQRHRGHVHGD